LGYRMLTTRMLLVAAALLLARPAAAQDQVKRGEYVFHAAGCAGCHTDVPAKGPLLAGGRALKTPYGIFYPPNITPDPTHGIGGWTEAEFVQALKAGIGKGGTHLFPAFPYPSYAAMTDEDAKALWAYLRTVPAVAKPNRAHEVSAPYGWRLAAWGWQKLFFDGPSAPPAPAGAPEPVKRGHYLANALGHCGECHSPRNRFGAVDVSRHLGGAMGPGGRIPNITSGALAEMNDDDLMTLFETGMKPDGDMVAGEMSEVVHETTSKLTPEDRKALIAYLRTVPALVTEKKK
jgi:mono/diheme cytochrome c family protein